MRHIRSWAPQFPFNVFAQSDDIKSEFFQSRRISHRVDLDQRQFPFCLKKSTRRSAMKTVMCVFFLSLAAVGQTVSFAAPKNYFAGAGCTSAYAWDLNGDHKKDIGCVSPKYITTHLGNGDGTFQGYVQTKWPYQDPPMVVLTHQKPALAVGNGGVQIFGYLHPRVLFPFKKVLVFRVSATTTPASSHLSDGQI